MSVLLRLLATIVIVVLAGWAAVSAWVLELAPTSPKLVRSIAPFAADAAIEQTARSQCFGLSDRCPPDTARTIAGELAAAAPVSPTPFEMIALQTLAAGDVQAAEVYAGTAIQRNPRSLVGLAVLADVAAARGDAPAQIDRIEKILALRRADPTPLLRVLAELAYTPDGMNLLRGVLAKEPEWAFSMVQNIDVARADPKQIAEIGRDLPEARAWLMVRLNLAYAPPVVFEQWLLMTGISPADVTWPFNPRFEKLAAPPPFNWTAQTKEAEFSPTDGLYVSQSGRSQGVIVSQMMFLPSGRHRLETSAAGESRQGKAGLAWRIKCVEGQPLGEVRLADLTAKSKVFNFDFEVPATGCAAQIISLDGLAAEFPKRTRTTIASISINTIQQPSGE
jgi:hypothetical protein